MPIDADLIFSIIIFAIPVVLGITIHESAHGYAARYFGDPTAASLGRITLNPLKHIDLMGTIIIPIVMLVVTKGTFVFGYAKPVPVNFGRLRNPKRDMLWVALAGPMSNFIQALLWALLLALQIKFGLLGEVLIQLAVAGISVNLVLAVLNLFPVPPLDGGRVLVSLLPMNAARAVSRIEPYGFFIVMGLVVMGILGTYWIRPLMILGLQVLDWVVFKPLGVHLPF